MNDEKLIERIINLNYREFGAEVGNDLKRIIIKKEQKEQQLQSNWNSLRKLIIKEINNTKKCIEFNIKNNLDYSEYKRDIVRFEFILDKMNELEGKDKE